jgi:phosphonate transport system substrate-binding protein
MLRKMKIAALTAFFAMASAAAARAEARYKFALVPEGNIAELTKKWEPLIKLLSDKSGLKLELVIETSYDAFYEKYAKGVYDFALINPLSYARKAPKGFYEPLARKDGKLQGLIVVAKDSPIQGIRDLSGKKIAYPSRDSYAATILNQLDLANAGVDPEKGAVYAGNHEKAYAELLAGRVDAAGGVMRSFLSLKPAEASKVRVLHTGLPVVSHPFVGRAKLPKEALKNMRGALVGLGSTPEGLAALKAAGMGGLVEADEDDYAALRK